MKETVVRYGYKPRDFTIPPKDAQLWRYMELSKLISILLTKSLHFTKVSLFNDPFEGAMGISENKEEYNNSEIFGLVYALLSPIRDTTKPFTVDQNIINEVIRIIEAVNSGSANETDLKVYNQAKDMVNQMDQARPSMREHTFVNCWHENSQESDAMWSLYSKDITNAIAVKTTYERLYLSLDRNPDIQIGRVNYIDFNKNFASTNSTHWNKRLSFSHEKEVRAVFIDPKQKKNLGVNIPVDLKTLIQSIYVSPKSEKWFTSIIKDILKKYKLNVPVEQSGLLAKPFY